MGKTIAEIVQDEVQAKIEAGEALQEALSQLASVQLSLEVEERAVAAARKRAVQAGWTEAQLRRAGLTPPKSRTTTRSPRSAPVSTPTS